MRQTLLTAGFAAALLLGATPGAHAQDVAFRTAQAGVPGPPGTVMFGGGLMADFVALDAFDGGQPIKDAPYSAEAATETIQPFADGNRIVRKTTASVYRDSRGRVRREQTLAGIAALIVPGDALSTVSITDAESGTVFILDPQQQMAFRQRPFIGIQQGPKGVFESRVAPSGGVSVTIGAGGSAWGPGGGSVVAFGGGVSGSPDRIRVARGEMRLEANGVPPGGPEIKREALGTREIEGVLAEGTRTTVTIPAGAIGNERAIESVSERWYSHELRVVVMSHQNDPRFGETTYRLTDIRRGEPSTDLFEVPPGYKVVDGDQKPPIRR
jgi:hypothetical protein